MRVNFSFPEVTGSILSEAPSGSIVRFLDSGTGAQSVAEAIAAPGENFFMVFDEGKAVAGNVDLVSLDGAMMIRRRDDRLVRVHKKRSWTGSLAASGVRLDSVKQGEVVLFGLTVPLFLDLKDEDRKYSFLYLVAKGNPSPAGKVALISLLGKKILVDEDLMVRVYERCGVELDLS